MSNLKEYGKWEVARYCYECGEFIARSDFFHNDALCLHCGARGTGAFPRVRERVRRKVYTEDIGRREAIEATKAKSGIFSFLKYQMTWLLRLMDRNSMSKERSYTWEDREEE